jgi:PAS domain S-box-containing protein
VPRSDTRQPRLAALLAGLAGVCVGAASATALLRRRRRVEREQLELARKLTVDLAEGLAEVDERGRVVYVNDAAARMLGAPRDQILGQPLHDLVHGAASALHGSECPPLAALHEGRPVQALEDAFGRGDGTAFPVSYTSSPVVRASRVVGAMVSFQDFSAHVRAEEAERFIEHATRAAAASIDWEATLTHVARLAVPFLGDCCMVVLDDGGGLRIVAAAHADASRTAAVRDAVARYPIDPGAAHGPAWIVRHGAPELVPDVDLDAFAAGPGPGARLRREILESIGLRSYMGVPLLAADRTLGAMLFGVTAPGRRHGAADLQVAQELAKRCALAIEHARLYREAREATQAREELLAVVSHDLRAPIAAVQLAADVAVRRLRKSGIPEVQRSADILHRAASRAARLVDDLVASARLERGRLVLERAPHAAADLAREALAVAEPVAEAQGVALSLEVDPGAGEVDCDAHRVLQVLSNLIGNALKVMPEGGALRVAVRRAGRDVAFDVSDTGPGIAPEEQPHVFERYWRSPGARYAGTGLGLSIARGLVEAHGGALGVRSAPGAGATFSFTLPAIETKIGRRADGE